MKKVFKKSLLSFGSFVFMLSLVTAETNFEKWGKTAAGSIADLFENIYLGPVQSSTILLGILLWMVLYSVVKEVDLFKGVKGMAPAIAVIITILAFIYLPDDFVRAVVAEYGALGATILTVVPFIIAIYFTVKITENLVVARIIWGIFGFYYLVIFGYVWATSETGTPFFKDPQNFIYLIAFIASVILFISIAWIRELWWKEEIKGLKGKAKRRAEEFGEGLDIGGRVFKVAAGEKVD
jgi:hypothetical protein